MSDFIELPESCRVTVKIFACCDVAGLETVISLGNLPAFVMPKDGGAGVLDHLPPIEGGWRLMTKAEVQDYLKREKEELDDEPEDEY